MYVIYDNTIYYFSLCVPQDGPVISFNAQTTLKNFCIWQQSQNILDDNHHSHHDTAILITRCKKAYSVYIELVFRSSKYLVPNNIVKNKWCIEYQTLGSNVTQMPDEWKGFLKLNLNKIDTLKLGECSFFVQCHCWWLIIFAFTTGRTSADQGKSATP